jgi:hypothetical protein
MTNMLLNHIEKANSPTRSLRLGLVWTSIVLISSMAAACSAGDAEDTLTDDDGDGVADSLGETIDADGDGKPDEFDIDGDGIPDGIGVDTDGDGKFDAIAVDADGDGIYESVDKDGDGMADVTAGDGDGDGPVITPGDGDGGIMLGDGDGVNPGDGNYCDEFVVDFVPRTPTVYVLVDRSSSMFEGGMFWENLKAGVLPVVDTLQADVRFGFGSYTGSNGACTGLTEGAPIAENNYAAIETAYSALAAPAGKGETPTAQSVQQAKDILLADDSPGDRFILLVTDGDPDFCNDPPAQCGADALIASLQNAASEGVRTLVFGIDNPGIQNPAWFDFYAQAGAGEMPNWADGLQVDQYTGLLQSQCTSQPEWATYKTTNGNAGQFDPAGKYSAEGGTATAFLNADPAALSQQILASVEGLKSCVIEFNFNVVNESAGEIFVDNAVIPTDQWQMNNENTIELLGDACTQWQSPGVTDFFAGFPCDAIVVR